MGEDSDTNAPHHQMQTIPLEKYLEDVLNAIDSSYHMAITAQHRRKMIRCLMGYKNKAEFDLTLQNLAMEMQWERAAKFVSDHLFNLDPPPHSTCAPMFQEGLRLHREGGHPNFVFQSMDFQNQNKHLAPSRFFSYLARGRAYQGQFERLLEDVAPNLKEQYADVIQEPPEIDLMKMLVLKECESTTVAESDDQPPAVQWKNQLMQLLEREFPNKGPQHPDDGGRSLGRRGESDLTSYLEGRVHNETRTSRMVVSNVYVKSPSKHLRQTNQSNNPSKRLHPVLILSNADLVGMTSEFDSIILEKDAVSETIRISELWEAKASLTPVTISDALFKKMQALREVLKDPDAAIYFNPRLYEHPQLLRDFLAATIVEDYDRIVGEDDSITVPLASHHGVNSEDKADCWEDQSPVGIGLGIFGMDLMGPKAAARRMQLIQCEKLLEQSVDAVLEGLDTGYLLAPDVRPQLESMLRAAQVLRPTLVVPMTEDEQV